MLCLAMQPLKETVSFNLIIYLPFVLDFVLTTIFLLTTKTSRTIIIANAVLNVTNASNYLAVRFFHPWLSTILTAALPNVHFFS